MMMAMTMMMIKEKDINDAVAMMIKSLVPEKYP